MIPKTKKNTAVNLMTFVKQSNGRRIEVDYVVTLSIVISLSVIIMLLFVTKAVKQCRTFPATSG